MALKARCCLLSVSTSPGVVVFHAEPHDRWTIPMYQGLAELQDQRIAGIQGDIHLSPQDEIPLWIVLIDPVDRCGAPKGIACVQRRPKPVIK